MKRQLVSYIFFISLLTSCSVFNNSFLVRHKTKKINLVGFNDTIKIGYETDSAIIYFGLSDIKKINNELLNSGKFEPRWDYRTIEDLKENLLFLNEINEDFTVKHWMNQKDSLNINLYNFAGIIDQWIFKELIFEKKAEIWDKSNKRFKKTIIYHFVRDNLGNEDCYYTFLNGIEFHRQVIALGL